MCGRFSRATGFSEIALRFRFQDIDPSADKLFLSPAYNISPAAMETTPVIIQEDNRLLRLMAWGLVPFWAKEPKLGRQMINARAETLMQKPSFKRPFLSRRCIVPATGFYEWVKEGKGKTPMNFRLKSGELFGFAGMWDRWKHPDDGGNELYSFTIITTTPNSLVAQVHNRMPVILRPEDEDQWLDPDLKGPAPLQWMLKPYPAEAMEGYAVTPAVNSPIYASEDCIAPLAG